MKKAVLASHTMENDIVVIKDERLMYFNNFTLPRTPKAEKDSVVRLKNDDNSFMKFEIRAYGTFRDKAIWLDDDYDYELAKDNAGATILIPLKKEMD